MADVGVASGSRTPTRANPTGNARNRSTTGESTVEFVDSAQTLGGLLADLASSQRYALDTEFHREKTYWPVLALVQIAWREPATGRVRVALIDPLRVDVKPLVGLLDSPALMVAHACDQDLEILRHACGAMPRRIFDTQIAAGFAGHTTASLASLVKSYLGLELAKGDRLTDWKARPLSSSQLAYAASDVEHLLDLADRIKADVGAAKRTTWVDQECQLLLQRCSKPVDARRSWWKLRDARTLRGASRGVAQEVAAWRERKAAEVDQPVRYVLPDLTIQAIAHRPPATVDDLNSMRGLDGRGVRPALAAEVLAAIERGRALTADEIVAPPSEDVPKEMRAPVALIMAWIAQVARRERIDPGLLATRADVAAFIRDDPGCRLVKGWRGKLLFEDLRDLREGKGALTFSRDGNLVLEESSGRLIGPRGGLD
ncbi:MAG: ribonuclease D [Acidimicrobiales bacterium]